MGVRTEVSICVRKRIERSMRALVALGLCAVSLHAQEDTDDFDTAAMEVAARAALERVEQDRESRGIQSSGDTQSARFRKRSTLGTADPIYRRGVPYFDEWTIRSGALKLRVPAYPGWQGIRASSEFYELQARTGQPGEHLALAIANADFVRTSRSKYVNYFGLIWVPQETAFLSMNESVFGDFKEKLRGNIVEERKRQLDRDDFLEFQDYLDFKRGHDERVEAFVDGFLLRAVDEADIVVYFSTSEFVYQTPRTEIRQPMIMTMTYALVRGKLLRFDFKRLFTSDEDPVELIAFTRQFIADMRAVNGLSERTIR